MNKLIIFIFLCFITTNTYSQDRYNDYGEKYVTRLKNEPRDVIIVESNKEIYEGYVTYGLYFPITLRDKDVFIIMDDDLLYLEYSDPFKVVVVIREKRKRKVKKILRELANKVRNSANNQVYYHTKYPGDKLPKQKEFKDKRKFKF